MIDIFSFEKALKVNWIKRILSSNLNSSVCHMYKMYVKNLWII